MLKTPTFASVLLVVIIAVLDGASAGVGAGATTAAAARADVYGGYLAPRALCKGQDAISASVRTERATMLCLVNFARKRRHLHPLSESSLLDRSASLKARAIIRCGEFSHTPCGRPFTTVFKAVGYTRTRGSWSVGENIAWGSGTLGSPRAMMDAWLNSPHHRANLFSAGWRSQGVALVRTASFLGYHGVAVWASQFGVRQL